MALPFRDRIKDPTPAELEFIARYAMLPEDPRRARNFEAFVQTGLPHRRLEAWKWTDFRAGLPTLESPGTEGFEDPFDRIDACWFTIRNGTITQPDDWPDNCPDGLRVFGKTDAQALGGAEALPLGALTAALSAQKAGLSSLLVEVTGPVDRPLHLVCRSGNAEASLARVTILVRPGASIEIVESHLGGAGFSSLLLDLAVQEDGRVQRTVYQRGAASEAQAVTADVSLSAGAGFNQTVMAFGARVSRLETRLVHAGPGAQATLNASYIAGPGQHVDLTTHVRHGAEGGRTRQLTKGAAMRGGRGVFQGKFHVPATVGQHTDAEMAHHALLMEDGAEVFAKPELEIYADDVECAHGNTCGALDAEQVFYLRQRGMPERLARALLTEAFIAEGLQAAPELLRDLLREIVRTSLEDSA